MFVIVVALIVLAGAVGAIYLILKSMGEDGIEVAAPGSCKSGRCGIRRSPMTDTQVAPEDSDLNESEGVKRKDIA